MSAGEAAVRDLVHLYVTADLPVRVKALPYADRLEVRFGNAFPVVLHVDRSALGQFVRAIAEGCAELERARRSSGGEG